MSKSSDESTTKNSKFNLEKSLDKLEEIVVALEDGDLSLEQAMKKFEQGVQLSKDCQASLSDTQQKIQELVEDADGLALKDFDTQSN